MQIQYVSISIPGPVRPHNEDFAICWQPTEPSQQRQHGAVAVLADGVGGQEGGEIASKTACDVAVHMFAAAPPNISATQILYQMFAAANIAIFDMNQQRQGASRMATTLTICMFRHNELNIGHVGDCRVYVVQQGKIRRITADHSYTGVQLRLGMITQEDARGSQMRGVLTRSVGNEPAIRVDYHTVNLNPGDVVVQMCDGMWAKLEEAEIQQAAVSLPPDQACRALVSLAEQRQADDNLSIQVVAVQAIDHPSYTSGLPQDLAPAVNGANVSAMAADEKIVNDIDAIQSSARGPARSPVRPKYSAAQRFSAKTRLILYVLFFLAVLGASVIVITGIGR